MFYISLYGIMLRFKVNVQRYGFVLSHKSNACG
jgi:hypothetical protein